MISSRLTGFDSSSDSPLFGMQTSLALAMHARYNINAAFGQLMVAAVGGNSIRPTNAREAPVSSAANGGFRRSTGSRGEIALLRDGGIGVEPVDHRHAGIEIELGDGFGRMAVEHHDEGAQRIAVRGHEHAVALQH